MPTNIKSNHLVYSILTLIVALNTLIAIFYLGINVPRGDDWNFVDDLNRFFSNTIDIEFLFRQHNEHRLFFPRIIMLIVTSLFHWNIKVLMYISFVVVVITYFVISNLYKDFAKERLGKFSLPETYLMIGIFVFSISQQENWLWGWQIQIFLNILFIIIGFNCLSKEENRNRNLLFAFVAGFIATFSFGNGVLFWPISLFFFYNSKYTKLQISVWLIVCVAIILFYFVGYQKPSHHPDMMYGLRNPLQLLEFILVYIGSPLINAHFHKKALLGVFGLALFFYFVYLIIKKNYFKTDRLLYVWLGLGFYALLSCGITSLSRVGISVDQSATSRYITICNLFWIMIFVLFNYLIAKEVIKYSKPIKYVYYLFIVFTFLNLFWWTLSTYNYFLKLPDYFSLKNDLPKELNSFVVDNEKRSALGIPYDCQYKDFSILEKKKLIFYNELK